MRIADLGLACWPVAGVTIAAAAGIRLRDSRRRNALNRALHELRRPLQALVLSSGSGQGPGAHALRVVICALDDLDREINGTERRVELRPVDCRALVQPAVERWCGIAATMRRSLVLYWSAGAVSVLADPDRVAQALDNLIHNALRHGGLRVSVHAEVGADGVRITVRDSGGAPRHSAGSTDPRHGHGLGIVSRVAAEHGGRFRMVRTQAGATATLELPLAPRALPAATRTPASNAERPALPSAAYW
jgi:two-component system sensor histidine kinase TctE